MKLIRFSVVVLILFLAACGRNEDQQKLGRLEFAESVAFGIIASRPEQSLREDIAEQSDVGDSAVYAAIERLVQQGRVVITERGLRAVK